MVGVEYPILLENKTQIRGKNNEIDDFKLIMVKKKNSSIIFNEQNHFVFSCFCANLLRWIVVSSTMVLSFFVDFRVGSSDDKI